MKMRVLFASILSCLSILFSQAQNVPQPKIMVIPYTSEGENIRTVLETDPNKRVILTKIKEGFDNRGVSTVDFVAKLKAMESSQVFNSDNKEDVKSLIVDMSGADIYVEAEMLYHESESGNSVKIILTAYEASGGASLSNKIAESGKFYTNDVSALAIRAVDAIADDFLDVMQNKFTDIAENGRSVMLQIGFNEDSEYTMESEVGNDNYLLQDIIEEWLSEMAYQGDYHLQGVTAYKMTVDDIKLPLTDENGKNYTVSKFGLELMRRFRGIGLQINRSQRGNTLYITVK